MFSTFLKLVQKPEPKSNTFFDTINQNVKINFNKFRDILTAYGRHQHFFNNVFLAIIIFGTILCLCQYIYISTAKPKQTYARKNRRSREVYKRAQVNFRANSRPFGFLPGSKIYVVHPDNREDFILSEGKRSIGTQTIVSIYANNMFIYGQLNQDIDVPAVRLQGNANKQSISNTENNDVDSAINLQEEEASSSSDDSTVIDKPSVIFRKPALSRIPVIVRRRKSTN